MHKKAIIILIFITSSCFAQVSEEASNKIIQSQGTVLFLDEYIFSLPEGIFEGWQEGEKISLKEATSKKGYFVSPEKAILDIPEPAPQKNQNILSQIANELLHKEAQKKHIVEYGVSATKEEIRYYSDLKNNEELREKIIEMINNGQITYVHTRTITLSEGPSIEGTINEQTIAFEGLDHYYPNVSSNSEIGYAYSENGSYIKQVLPNDISTYPKIPHMIFDERGAIVAASMNKEIILANKLAELQPSVPTKKKQETDASIEEKVQNSIQNGMKKTIALVKEEGTKDVVDIPFIGIRVPTITLAFIFLGILGILTLIKR